MAESKRLRADRGVAETSSEESFEAAEARFERALSRLDASEKNGQAPDKKD